MNAIIVTLPAQWASALVNKNMSDLDFNDPTEAKRCRTWLNDNNDLNVVDVGQMYCGRFGGKQTEVADFTAYTH